MEKFNTLPMITDNEPLKHDRINTWEKFQQIAVPIGTVEELLPSLNEDLENELDPE